MGLNPEAVFEFAREQDKASLEQAIQRQVSDRSTAGYQELARQYYANLDTIDPDAILEANFDEGTRAFVAGDGTICLQLPDGEQISWKMAVEMGYVGTPRFSD